MYMFIGRGGFLNFTSTKKSHELFWIMFRLEKVDLAPHPPYSCLLLLLRLRVACRLLGNLCIGTCAVDNIAYSA